MVPHAPPKGPPKKLVGFSGGAWDPPPRGPPPGRSGGTTGGPRPDYDTTRFEIEAKGGSLLSHAEQVGGFFGKKG